jgi:hypothetical protein
MLHYCTINKIIMMKLLNIKKDSPTRDCNNAIYTHAVNGESLIVL